MQIKGIRPDSKWVGGVLWISDLLIRELST